MGTGATEARTPYECIFWAKFDSKGPRCLPLAAHCLDVALTFRALCDLPGFRRSLVSATETSLSDKHFDRLAVLAMLHDVGKANLGFQFKVFDPKAPQAGHVRELAPLLDFDALDVELHEAFMQQLPPELADWFADEESAYSYLLATFSHHGRPLRFKGEKSGHYSQASRQWWRPRESWDPMAAVGEVSQWCREAFPGAFLPGGEPLPVEARFHHRFAGLVMLADWLGSHQAWFPIEPAPLADRLRSSRATVPDLLRATGLDVRPLRPQLAQGPSTFETRFGLAPRPLQQAIDHLDPNDDRSRLVIAESETGSGKTEAAIHWWAKLFAAGKVDGLYFALPTRVAAREIYTRVRQTIERWFPDPETKPVTVLAVPGYAQVDGCPLDRVLPEHDAANLWQDDGDLRRRERFWAAEHPKRFLAATVAVGTVDQALLSAVQTAHAHLRSVCLDRSLLVVDEVHASDEYMSRLLEGLLDHHLRVGGRAMLLSATLGARARQRYVARATGSQITIDLEQARQTPYPAVTLADGIPRSLKTAPAMTKQVLFEELPLAFQLEKLVGYLVPSLADGARILVVLNTVDRANALLRLLENRPEISREMLFHCDGVICPHHGRFAPADRTVLDARVTQRFGPGTGPGPIVLVGTQTLEQSLDIDCDLMVTDLAPADVLLQRVGRLHRHKRCRPAGYEQARCLVLTPQEELVQALEPRGTVAASYRRLGYGSVYEDLRTLELTRRALQERPLVSVPQDNRWLVEAVTHPEQLGLLKGELWDRHAQTVEGEELAKAVAASYAATVYDQYFGEFEFNEAGGKVVVRLGANNLQLKLDRPLLSPFGQTIEEVIIPGHLAPEEPDETVKVEEAHAGRAVLRCGDRRYQYSRYGLEATT